MHGGPPPPPPLPPPLRPLVETMGQGSTKCQARCSLVGSVAYNANNQMTQIAYGDDYVTAMVTEYRGYNTMYQLASLSANWWSVSGGYGQTFSETYNFASGQNNGQIASVVEGTGETVSYQYDQLKRLTSAGSTAGWSQTYTYDGFGNMTSRSPGFNIQANPATNWMVGFNYDANGNLYEGSWVYDPENRLVNTGSYGGDQYAYDPSNKRIYKQGSAGETYFFYGLDGKVIGEYSVGWNGTTLQLNRTTESAYFGGKKVWPVVVRDRLGSVRGECQRGESSVWREL